jgi:hypothetical protein
MPAWEFRLQDRDIWTLTAFVVALPQQSPRDMQAQLTPPVRERDSRDGAKPQSLGSVPPTASTTP